MSKFNYEEFALALSTKRFEAQVERKKQIGFRVIAKEADVSLSTVARAMNQEGKLELENAINLCAWMERPITDFITD